MMDGVVEVFPPSGQLTFPIKVTFDAEPKSLILEGIADDHRTLVHGGVEWQLDDKILTITACEYESAKSRSGRATIHIRWEFRSTDFIVSMQ